MWQPSTNFPIRSTDQRLSQADRSNESALGSWASRQRPGMTMVMTQFPAPLGR
jgi:hypothetical protein